MQKISIKDLLVDHDYYCSSSNYHSNDCSITFDTFAEFYDEFKDADVDMNLVFRWDLHKKEDGSGYYLEIFQMRQRKGLFIPIRIDDFQENDTLLLEKYLRPHIETLQNIWRPFSFH